MYEIKEQGEDFFYSVVLRDKEFESVVWFEVIKSRVEEKFFKF